MLKIRELTKTFSSGVQALKGVTLDVSSGMFGLLGPNGAGKTTLMKILATLLEPDSGSAEFDALDLIHDKMATRRILGYLPQEFGFYPSLNARQTLNYFAKLKGVVDGNQRNMLVAALLERVNLAEVGAQRVGTFSGGMKQRLGIAQALIGRPRLLIVDEPTAGLDPEERARFHNLLSEMAEEDTVVMLSTHIVSDISNLCSQMAIIRKGEIISSCTPREAIQQLTGSIWEGVVEKEKLDVLKSRCRVISSHAYEGRIRMRVYEKAERPDEQFQIATPSLEDYYFSISTQPSNSSIALS
jgi:ABC-type multidrug transport system ATPase subunit